MIYTLSSQLKNLTEKGLVPTAAVLLEQWLSDKKYESFLPEVERLVQKGDIEALNDAFYQVIPFGTGGRRGKMGAGPNRINKVTIAESAQGFLNYLINQFGFAEIEKRGLVVTYDTRHNSRLFAETAVGVFAGNGVPVYFYNDVRSTPQISCTIRLKQALGGVMLSASHNPPGDNGIKIYWQTGGQVLPPHDAGIIEQVKTVSEIKQIDFAAAVTGGLVRFLGEAEDAAYQQAVADLSLGEYRDVKIVFTPMHGCASTSFLPVLKRVGFKGIEVVASQMSLDPDFSGVTKHYPNPEVPISLDVAIKQAKESLADLVLASDPDADRIGVVSRETLQSSEYIFLNGNQIAVLLLDYITLRLAALQSLPAKGVIVKTVVTTDLLSSIARAHHLRVIDDVPVGFKYIAHAIDHRLEDGAFVFGAEESHGYLRGTYARDKDGAIAALLISEYAALLKSQGQTLFQQLEKIKWRYGYYREIQQSLFFTGMDGMSRMQKIMSAWRTNPPKRIGQQELVSLFDQLEKKVYDLKNGAIIEEYTGFADNALIFYASSDRKVRLVVRPSGTEPKIKFYVAVGKDVGLEKTAEQYHEIKIQTDVLAKELLEGVVALAESVAAGGQRSEILG